MNSLPSHLLKPASSEPQRLGRYALRYRVAQGGMASVYLAQLKAAEGFYKWVAIKAIHPHIAEDPKFVRMFLDEARLAARLDHPNVCTVFDFGRADDQYYLAMEYLHGESLSSVAKRRWKPGGLAIRPTIAARIVADAARGLHAAHELRNEDGRLANVVHRDVSPQNIFVLYEGNSKVVDFGIARSSESAAEQTATGELKGKLPYMSPEQMNHEVCDRRTDIWALGVVLWEITVGKRLFKRETEPMTIIAVTQRPIPRPSAHRPGYPEDLEAIVMRALERNPVRRYATAAEMARELEGFIGRSAEPAYVDDVAAMMKETFADQISFRTQLLQRGTAESPLEVVDTEPATGTKGHPVASGPLGEGADPTVPIETMSEYLESFGGSMVPEPPRPVPLPPASAPMTAYAPMLAPGAVTRESTSNVIASAPVAPRSSGGAGRWLLLGVLFFAGIGTASFLWVSRSTRAAAANAAADRATRSTPSPTPAASNASSTANPAPTPAPALANAPAPAPTTAPALANAPAPAPTAAPAIAQPAAAPTPTPATANPPAPTAAIAPAATAPNTHAASAATPPTPADAHHAPRPRPRENAAANTAASAPSEPVSHGIVNRPGYLYVRSSENAEVFESSRSLGHTPIMDHELPAGHHVLHLVSPNGSRDVSVDIQPGVSAMLTIRW